MTNDSSSGSSAGLNNDPDFDPDATIELSKTKIAAQRAMLTPSTPLPESIGKYRILSEIGEGGMGTVYEAEQDSPRRKVALKVIKAGVVSRNLLHRFEIEAQILGKLDHPGIATIFEAGTFDEGHGKQPFFAMEFVQGKLLTDYANKHKLGTRDRLGLLAKIADAVQHAHQKGVIHRDLKPGNILVNNEGQIKILDFGVARATDADIQTTTMQTDIGQLIGTIPYMSPEQASGNPDDLDTRSDVYAIGVIAYELLTGQMPYDLNQMMIHEAVRVIREDEPRALSSINNTFRGDVEIIVGKALVKEKERRYQSASDLSSDIERYLNNEPIEARPPSTWYHLRKFSRRNKALVAGIAAVLVVSVVGALISINFAMGEAEQKRIAIDNAEQAREAQQAAETARAEESKRADELQQVADFQSEQLSSIDAALMGTRLRESIIDAAPEDSKALLTENLSGINFTNIGLESMQANVFEPAIAAIDTQFKDQPLVQTQLLQTVANTLIELGLLDLAANTQRQALTIRRAVLGNDHPSTLASINNMGLVLVSQGKLNEAEQYHREGLESSRRILGNEDPGTLLSINNFGTLLHRQGKLDEAEPYYREALASSRRILGDEDPDTLRMISNMGALLRSQGKLDEAELFTHEALENCRRVFGDEHLVTLGAMNDLGYLLRSQGKLDEAEPYSREALEVARNVLGDEHPATLTMISNLGSLLRSQGKPDEAELYTREALETRRRVFGDDNPSTLISIANMGALLQSQDRLDEAEPYLREALEIGRRVLGDEHPDTLVSINNMGVLLQSQDRLDEAELYTREALEISRRALGDQHPDTLLSIHGMNVILRKLNRLAEAEALGAEAVELGRKSLPEGHWYLGLFLNGHGQTLLQMQRFDEAEETLTEAYSILETALGSDHTRTNGATLLLVDMYTAWHAAEPGAGHDDLVAQWQAKLDAVQNDSEDGG